MIDTTNAAEKYSHDHVVSLVESIIGLYKQYCSDDSSKNRQIIKNLIDATEEEIDREVYDLYGLTVDEIEVIENEDS
jgi:sulfite reductase beta subunit-like hemoprotein